MDLMKLPVTLREIEKDLFYTFDYTEDYHFDKFMKTGANSFKELLDFIGSEVLGCVLPEFDTHPHGCSTYAAQLKNGERVFGRNFDVDPCARILMRTRPKNGYASLSMVNLQYSGITLDKLPLTDDLTPLILTTPYAALDGVNEKGLAVGVLSARYQTADQRTGKLGFTTTSSMRMVLDHCATVKEAVEIYGSYDMHSREGANYHFHLADAHGDSVIIEYVDNIMHIIENRYCTNFLLTPGMDRIGSGHDRYEKLEKVMAENGGVFEDTDDAMKPLSMVAEGGTRWSCVYNLTNPSVMLVNERKYDNPYYFTLENFDQ